jgi:hypothetical protein
MTIRLPEPLVLFVIACGLIALADATAQPRVAAAGAPAGGGQVFGDGDHNGQVDFNDITATISNWLFGVTLAPGQTAPPAPIPLPTWSRQRVVKLHSMAIEGLESPEFTIIVVRGSAGEVAAELGVGVRTIGGMRGLDWPGGWPPWPPPGSALEELMDAWAANVGEWNQEQVEAAAQAVINQLLAKRAAAQRKAKP